MNAEWIEEQGVVTAVDGDRAWVKTQRQSTCGSCQAKSGCGTASLAKVLGRHHPEVEVDNPVNAAVGDQVVVAIPAQALVMGAAWMYLFPLLVLFLSALASNSLGLSEPVTVLISIIGFIISLLVLSRVLNQYASSQSFRPVIKQRIIPAALVYSLGHS